MLHRQYICNKLLSLFLNSILQSAGGAINRNNGPLRPCHFESTVEQKLPMNLSWYLWS